MGKGQRGPFWITHTGSPLSLLTWGRTANPRETKPWGGQGSDQEGGHITSGVMNDGLGLTPVFLQNFINSSDGNNNSTVITSFF